MKLSTGKSELRERLLAADTVDGALRAQYERKLNAMFEIKLSRLHRFWLKGLAVFSSIAGLAALVLGLTETMPLKSRTAILIGAAFAMTWTIFFVRLLIRGTIQRRIDRPMAAGMAFGFSLIMCIVLALGGLPTDRILLIGMLFLLPAAILLLRSIVEQSEMRTQEQLAELQYRLARLAEKLDDGEGNSGAGVLR